MTSHIFLFSSHCITLNSLDLSSSSSSLLSNELYSLEAFNAFHATLIFLSSSNNLYNSRQ